MSAPLISAKNLSHRYGKTLALDDVSIEMQSGQVTALLGPNGAGKSTLIHLLLGLMPAQSGRIEVLGRAPAAAAKSGQWGTMLQASGVQETLTVTELLNLFASLYPLPADIESLVDEAGLDGLERARFDRLSGGQKQRVMFALALIGQPRLLILDEPTTGLDPAARRRLWEVISERRSQGVSVLLCTHYMDEAETLADRIIVLNRGRVLAEGSADEIKSRVPRAQILARSELTVDELLDLPAVQSAQPHEQRFSVLSSDAPATLRAWLAADQELSRLEVKGADLEAAFLQLTDNAKSKDLPS